MIHREYKDPFEDKGLGMSIGADKRTGMMFVFSLLKELGVISNLPSGDLSKSEFWTGPGWRRKTDWPKGMEKKAIAIHGGALIIVRNENGVSVNFDSLTDIHAVDSSWGRNDAKAHNAFYAWGLGVGETPFKHPHLGRMTAEKLIINKLHPFKG